MELFNELSLGRTQAIEDFLTFIPIYESAMRHRSLRAFLKKHRQLIEGKICVEAGAGRGLFSAEMVHLGARKVIALERSKVLFDLLSQKHKKEKRIQLVQADITKFRPKEEIDFLFHEFYGPLILDEALPALQKLKFQPHKILPDGGRLWAMPLSEKQILAKDDIYESSWKKNLEGALVSDLFTGIPFQPKWKIFDWDVHEGKSTFRFTLPEKCDWIALCGEITHEGKSVLKLWRTGNWPVIFTPVAGKVMQLHFRYTEGFTKVYLDWK